MAIRYIEQDRTFWLDTEHTSYIMAVVDEENFVGHVYYGQKLQYTEGTPAPVYLMRTGEAPFVPSKNNRERVSFFGLFPYGVSGERVRRLQRECCLHPDRGRTCGSAAKLRLP